MHFILQTLEDRFKAIGLQKIEDRRKKNKAPFPKKESREKCSLATDISEDLKEKKTDAEQQVSGWTPAHVRKQLAIGVNGVTRALERSELLLVLVCKFVKPAIITLHLIQLSLSRTVPSCHVPHLSERITPVIGLKCVLALGFKKNTSDFVDEVKAIIPRVPSLSVPWLQDRTKDAGEDLQTEPVESQDREFWTLHLKTFENLRKLAEGRRASVTLQPLKIKKVIPNPNKIRKPPKSKKVTSK
ncbi:Ribonuclease P protein subunit p38 [Saguinus oedipus]|uniref:Ribonuclease P protein subunit p38 n=1 Tax=Saguinus oedipus TaxID=9490 RepID=A0ABQ9TXA2_SAGOE|nr:Ribonuclease P protein subunit p38 [Saguinus oedipus]